MLQIEICPMTPQCRRDLHMINVMINAAALGLLPLAGCRCSGQRKIAGAKAIEPMSMRSLPAIRSHLIG